MEHMREALGHQSSPESFYAPCAVCQHKRNNICLFPCNHAFHARCISQWPINTCPYCSQHVTGIKCLEAEPFIVRGKIIEISNNAIIFGTLRKGRWSKEEEKYVQSLIDVFNSGLVPIAEKCKLALFLSRILQCPLGRLASKIKTGKKVYAHRSVAAVTQEDIAQYITMQRFLSEHEEQFLNRVATSSDVEEAAILSFHIQYFWTQSFIHSQSGQLYPLIKPLTAPKIYSLPMAVLDSFRSLYTAVCSHTIMRGHCVDSTTFERERLDVIFDNLNERSNPSGALVIITALDSQRILLTSASMRDLVRKFPELEPLPGKNVADVFDIMFHQPSAAVAAITVKNASGEFMNEDVTDYMFTSQAEKQQLTAAGVLPVKYRSLARVHLCEDIDWGACLILNAFVDNLAISFIHMHRYSATHGCDFPVAPIDRTANNSGNGIVPWADSRNGMERMFSKGAPSSSSLQSIPTFRSNYGGSQYDHTTLKGETGSVGKLPYEMFFNDGQSNASASIGMPLSPASQTSFAERHPGAGPGGGDYGGSYNYHAGQGGDYNQFDTNNKSLGQTQPLPQPLLQSTYTDYRDPSSSLDPIAEAVGSLKRKRDALATSTSQWSEDMNGDMQVQGGAGKQSSQHSTSSASSTDKANNRDEFHAPLPPSKKKTYSNSTMPLHVAVGNFFLQTNTTIGKGTLSPHDHDTSSISSTSESPLSPKKGQLTPHLANLFSESSDLPQWNVSTCPKLASIHFEGPSPLADDFAMMPLTGRNKGNSLDAILEREIVRSENADDSSQSTSDTPILLSSYTESAKDDSNSDDPKQLTDADRDLTALEPGVEVAMSSSNGRLSRDESAIAKKLGSKLYKTLMSVNHRHSDKDIFNTMLVSFLRRIPFDVIELWVPVQISPTTTVLLFGGSATSDEKLRGWSSYSRNFFFSENEGVPGRVSAKKSTECNDDVATKDKAVYKRADGAATYGIHASVAMPLGLNERDPVIVLYSKKIFKPTPLLVEFMREQLKSLRLRSKICIH